MRILQIAVKDLMQILRDWKAAAFLLVAPILFTLLMGFMMGGWSSPDADNRLPIGVLDRDEGLAGTEFIRLAEKSESVRLIPLTEADSAGLEETVANGDLAAAVVFPAGYSAALLAGDPAQAEIIAPPAFTSGAGAEPAVRTLLTRLAGSAQAARLATDEYQSVNGFASQSDRDSFAAKAFSLAIVAWTQAPAGVVLEAAGGAVSDATAIPGGFAQSSPGNMVTFALAGLIGAAEIIVGERKSGTLARLLTTSIPRGAVLAGHFLAMCALIFAQILLLGVVGQLAFQLPYWQEPVPFLIMAVAITLWIAGMGLLIGVIARNSDQVAMLAIVPMLALAGLGGAWMPLEVTGPAFQAIGRLTPTAWAMQGLQNLILRGQSFAGVLLPAGILLAFGVGLIALAGWKFTRE